MNSLVVFPRIIIMTENLSEIVKPLVNKYSIVGIVKTQKRTKEDNYILRYMKYFYKILRKNHLKEFAKINSLPYYLMNNGSDSSLEAWVKAQKPNLIVIYSMPELLKENILNIPTHKTINLHPSFLPKYRGANPFFWHYYNNEKKGGVTIHFIDKGEDTGNIIYQEEYPIERGMPLVDMKKLAVEKIGIKLLFRAIENIDNISSRPQIDTDSSKARNLNSHEYKTLINWEEMSIEQIWHIFRGFQYWIETLTTVNLIDKCYLWKIDNYEKENMKGYIVGRLYRENNSYFISCKDGKIHLSLKGFKLKLLLYQLYKILFNR
jgi:methionyl-tRNA formyltransferase